ncbi:hypothetical protein VAEKB19_5090003 [Vibrio aestuarianus]|nr:hypothetical protein VAEKB19_5090003 [Vibrio aestuarianus]
MAFLLDITLVNHGQWKLVFYRTVDPLVGVGIRYSPSRVWSLHSEYRFIDGVGDNQTQQADLHSLFVGFSINFDLFNSSEDEDKAGTHTTARPATIDTTETKVISTHDSLSVVHNKTLFTFNSAKLENTPLLSQLENRRVEITFPYNTNQTETGQQ